MGVTALLKHYRSAEAANDGSRAYDIGIALAKVTGWNSIKDIERTPGFGPKYDGTTLNLVLARHGLLFEPK
jgi:hypothetical protein